MLTRLYVNNFRTLVNFEIKFANTGLLLGNNGSGKSSVFDVLRKLRDFIGGEEKLADTFSKSDLTSWQTSNLQKFEIELDVKNGKYLYTLEVEYSNYSAMPKIKNEKLTMNETTLFEIKLEKLISNNASYSSNSEGIFYNDNGKVYTKADFKWTQSGLSLAQKRMDNTKLTAFKKYINNIAVVRPIPFIMSQYSKKEEKNISVYMENFSAWYRYLMQEEPSAIKNILKELEFLGIDALKTVEAGEQRALKVDFKNAEGKIRTYNFDSLSDGQKMLIAIYSIIIGNMNKESCIFIDEPDNFVSIREIQPWLRLFIDDCGKDEVFEQVILISHHPEIIDYSPLENFTWFEREPEQHTRIKLLEGLKNKQALPLSQLFTRGFIK